MDIVLYNCVQSCTLKWLIVGKGAEVFELLEKGYSAVERDKHGWCPIHYAAWYKPFLSSLKFDLCSKSFLLMQMIILC